ncbi:MAG: DUF3857 domain-containing protein [Pyrinomonadaceae bacterium]
MKNLALPILFLLFSSYSLAADDWTPVTDAELRLEKGVVDPNADAEKLYYEVSIKPADQFSDHYEIYSRIKIFNERGRDLYGKCESLDDPIRKVVHQAARITRPDRTSEEFSGKKFVESTIAKNRWSKIKKFTAIFSNVVPGSVVECKFRLRISLFNFGYSQLAIQDDIPSQKVVYRLDFGRRLKYLAVMANSARTIEDTFGDSKRVFEFENVAAKSKESFVPPWAAEGETIKLQYFPTGSTAESQLSANQFAAIAIKKFLLKEVFEQSKQFESVAASIVSGAADREQAAEMLFRFCAMDIKKMSSQELNLSVKEKEKFWDQTRNSTAAKLVLEKKYGDPLSTDELFASLAFAAGFETRYVFASDLRTKKMEKSNPSIETLEFSGIALKINDNWKFYDPGREYARPGVLPWFYTGQEVMLLDSKSYLLANIPASPARMNFVNRSAKIKLDGQDIAGTLTIEIGGARVPGVLAEINAAKKADVVDGELVDLVSSFVDVDEITSVSWIPPEYPDYSVQLKCEFKKAKYATVSGTRIFFTPNIFNDDLRNAFREANRLNDIFFGFGETGRSDIEFEIPAGYKLESLPEETVKHFPNFGFRGSVATNVSDNQVNMKHVAVISDGYVSFPAELYPTLRENTAEIVDLMSSQVILKRQD